MTYEKDIYFNSCLYETVKVVVSARVMSSNVSWNSCAYAIPFRFHFLIALPCTALIWLILNLDLRGSEIFQGVTIVLAKVIALLGSQTCILLLMCPKEENLNTKTLPSVCFSIIFLFTLHKSSLIGICQPVLVHQGIPHAVSCILIIIIIIIKWHKMV